MRMIKLDDRGVVEWTARQVWLVGSAYVHKRLNTSLISPFITFILLYLSTNHKCPVCFLNMTPPCFAHLSLPPEGFISDKPCQEKSTLSPRRSIPDSDVSPCVSLESAS